MGYHKKSFLTLKSRIHFIIIIKIILRIAFSDISSELQCKNISPTSTSISTLIKGKIEEVELNIKFAGKLQRIIIIDNFFSIFLFYLNT